MSKVITLVSTKGSVGKTALAIHIGGYLASSTGGADRYSVFVAICGGRFVQRRFFVCRSGVGFAA